METPQATLQDRVLRLIIISVVVGAVLIAAAFFGYRAYVHWQAPRLAKRAQLAVYRNQLREASLLAQRAYQLDPNNVETARAAADIAERQGQSEAILWRQRAIKAKPDSLADRLALARTALHFNKIAEAREALDAIPAKDRETAEYHAGRAELAVAMKQPEKADAQYSEALKLAPQNDDYKFQRALVDLRLLDKRASARETLRGFFADPKLGQSARRALLADAFAAFDWQAALPIAGELANAADASFGDRLVYLDILRRSGSDDLAGYLSQVQAAATKLPDDVGPLLIWMKDNGRTKEAIQWAATLPAATRAAPNVKAAVALCHLAMDDWATVEQMVTQGNWQNWEYLRLAILARTLQKSGNRDLFETTWTNAVAAAATRPDGLRQLLRLTNGWGWTTELRALYWALVENPAERNAALEWLYNSYLEEKNTAGLERVMARLAKITPDDDRVRNNLVMFALLAGRATAGDFQTARELYRKHPGDPNIVSTNAYALLLQGHLDDALKIMRALRPEELKEPSIATYYGLLLTAKGEKAEARKYLELAKTGSLLPEEKRLVAEAERTLQ